MPVRVEHGQRLRQEPSGLWLPDEWLPVDSESWRKRVYGAAEHTVHTGAPEREPEHLYTKEQFAKSSKAEFVYYWDRAVPEGVQPGASQPGPSGSVSGVAKERRQAADGKWYTMEQFAEYYKADFAYHWGPAVREAVPPGASDRRTGPARQVVTLSWLSKAHNQWYEASRKS